MRYMTAGSPLASECRLNVARMYAERKPERQVRPVILVASRYHGQRFFAHARKSRKYVHGEVLHCVSRAAPVQVRQTCRRTRGGNVVFIYWRAASLEFNGCRYKFIPPVYLIDITQYRCIRLIVVFSQRELKIKPHL